MIRVTDEVEFVRPIIDRRKTPGRPSLDERFGNLQTIGSNGQPQLFRLPGSTEAPKIVHKEIGRRNNNRCEHQAQTIPPAQDMDSEVHDSSIERHADECRHQETREGESVIAGGGENPPVIEHVCHHGDNRTSDDSAQNGFLVVYFHQ